MSGPAPLITGTDFITVATEDFEAAVEFYGSVLGRANNHPIELRVDDVATARAELESRGVAFKGETIDSGVCHQAHFSDPDGNALAIHHRYAPPA